MSRFGGESLVPGIQAERLTVEAELTWGKAEQQIWNGGIIVSTATDVGHTGQTSQLRPGLIMAQIVSTGKLVAWSPYPTSNDGSGRIAGFLNHHIDLTLDNVASDRYTNLLFTGGNIKAPQIIIPPNVAAGLAGDDLEFLIRNQLKHRFIFDDDIYGEYTSTGKVIETAAATLTVLIRDNNSLITNTGSSTVLTLTLPDPLPGLHYEVMMIGAGAVGSDINVDSEGGGNDFMDGTEDLSALVALDALDFSLVTFDGVRTVDGSPDTFKYMVNRSAS